MKLFLLALLFAGTTLAQRNDLSHRPRSFSSTQGKAVFVDFISADYDITYDASKRLTTVVSTIKFNAPEAGLPVFDAVEPPLDVKLDGEDVTAMEVKTPNRETTVRVMGKNVTTGAHTAVITSQIGALVEYVQGGIKSAFWTSDLSDRRYLERYMPASFEYDQVKMTFNISFVGTTARQKFYTNGVVREVKRANKSVIQISFPSHFNSSSIFFHTVPEGATQELRWSLRSVDGREIPAVVYSGTNSWGSNLAGLKERATNVFHELEGDYGAWPHASLVILNAGSGGMEYCGATMTDASALGHEMFHSYFARGVMPANGNSGWLDEALASWRDGGYRTLDTLNGSSMMSNHPYYTRTTDMDAYSFGKNFMAYLDGKLKSKGGIKPFMRHMVENRKFAPLFVEEFIKEMNQFYSVNLDEDFRKYTYGTRKAAPTSEKSLEDVHHRKMSMEELKKYL